MAFKVMIECPTTNQWVPTGFGAETEEAFKGAILQGNSFECESCGQMHRWDKTDAKLEEA